MRKKIVANNILNQSFSDFFKKGGFPIGTVRVYSGVSFVKVADTGGKGDWIPESQVKKHQEAGSNKEESAQSSTQPFSTFDASPVESVDSFYDEYIDDSDSVSKEDSKNLEKYSEQPIPYLDIMLKHDVVPDADSTLYNQYKTIKSTLKKFKLKKNTITYGGFNLSNFKIDQKRKFESISIGDKFELKGFFASSLKQSTTTKYHPLKQRYF